MARSRYIRPDFFTDARVGELQFGARLLLQSCWCQADLRGVFEYSPKVLRAVTFPFDEGITSANVTEWLEQLEGQGLIRRFEARGQTWAVCNWAKQGPFEQSFPTSEQKAPLRRPEPPPFPPPDSRPSHVRPTSDDGQTEVSVSMLHSPDSSLQTPGDARAHEPPESDLSLTKTGSTGNLPPTEAWRYERNEPWVQVLLREGAKIGPNNWQTWQGTSERLGGDLLIRALRATPAEDRWPDRTESAAVKIRARDAERQRQEAAKAELAKEIDEDLGPRQARPEDDPAAQERVRAWVRGLSDADLEHLRIDVSLLPECTQATPALQRVLVGRCTFMEMRWLLRCPRIAAVAFPPAQEGAA